MARLWSQWKQLWGHKQQPFTLFVALKAAGQIVDEALAEDVVRASWAQCGWRLGEKFDYDKIFVERKQEVFQSMRDAPNTPAKSKALAMVQNMSPKRTKHACGVWVGVDCKYCPGCGKENPDFDFESAALLRQGHRSGWKKPAPLEDCELDEDKEKDGSRLLNQLDDLMKELRKKNDNPVTPAATVAPAAADPAPPASASSSAAPALQDQPTEKEEFDMECVDDVVDFLKCHWSEPAKAAAAESTLRFAVQSMKARSSRTEPLSEIVQKEVLKSKILMKPHGRAAFLASWADKRAVRFVKKPDFAKGKWVEQVKTWTQPVWVFVEAWELLDKHWHKLYRIFRFIDTSIFRSLRNRIPHIQSKYHAIYPYITHLKALSQQMPQKSPESSV